jgi:hypothetical protein
VAAEGRVPEQVLILPGIQPDDRLHRIEASVWREVNELADPGSGASGCAGSAGMTRICRSTVRWRRRTSPPPRSRRRAAGPR